MIAVDAWLPVWHQITWLWGGEGQGGANGNGYLVTSGPLVLAGIATWVRHHNCEVHGCWRLGRHGTAAGHQVCRRHHPDGHLSPKDVHDAHRDALTTGRPAAMAEPMGRTTTSEDGNW